MQLINLYSVKRVVYNQSDTQKRGFTVVAKKKKPYILLHISLTENFIIFLLYSQLGFDLLTMMGYTCIVHRSFCSTQDSPENQQDRYRAFKGGFNKVTNSSNCDSREVPRQIISRLQSLRHKYWGSYQV